MEDNKLIAEFMGFQHTSIGWYDADEYLNENDNTFDTLRFDVDWNWLMPVVEKILNISLELDSMEAYYNITDSVPNIEQTHEAVVEFIKWYDNQNK